MLLGIGRNTLLVLLAFTFSGGVLFLITVSPYLLYAYYAATLACAAICLWVDHRSVRNLRAVGPYLVWLGFFFAWGTLVSPDKGLVLPEALKAIGRDILILGAVAAALASRRDMGRLVQLIQIAVIGNFAIALWEAFHPDLIATIAYTLAPDNTAFELGRPAGLWSNPNEAAFAYILALVASYWGRSVVVWAGRMAALAGIYLTASRSGFYIVSLLGVVLLFYRLKPWLLKPRLAPLLLSGLALTGWFGLVLFDNWDSITANASANYSLGRVLDISESASQAIGQESRLQVALTAARAALDAPWFGDGVFTFQGSIGGLSIASPLPYGAHNIYLAVWGEAGILGIVGYLGVLLIGIDRLFRLAMTSGERLAIGSLWLAYLIIGFVWHNQPTSSLAMLFVGLLYLLPYLATRSKPGRAISGPGNAKDLDAVG